MTTAESFMLSVCFGATVGAVVANAVVLIKSAIDNRRERKRLRK